MTPDFQTDYVIEIKNLTKTYKDFKLENISFNIESGCITGFIGRNGAGKSTTIKSILNMISIDSGEINIFGINNIKNELIIKENIGVVFDNICFHKKLNGKHINKILKSIYKEWDEHLFFDYLHKLNVPKDKKVSELSRGMQMKLQIATALSHNAKLLIMDEPTGGLDPIVRNEILDIFMEYIQDDSHSILLSSHIISDIERIADNIVFIDNGKILLNEDKETLAKRHRIIKCSLEQFESINKDLIISSRKSTFGVELLTDNISEFNKNYPYLLCEKGSIEDIMLFYVNKN